MTRPRGAALAALGLLLACQTGHSVQVDELAAVDWSGYRSFAVGRAGEEQLALGPSAADAARRALTGAFVERGLQHVDPEQTEAQPHLRVSAWVRTEIEREPGQISTGVGYPEVVTHRTGVGTPVGNVPLGSDTTVVHHPGAVLVEPPQERAVRTVVVDVFEARGGRHLWRGTSTNRWGGRDLDPEELAARIRAIVARYPLLD